MPNAQFQRCLVSGAMLLLAGVSQAAVSDADAAKLGKELTPIGAERAANKDGSIPSWEGGVTKAPSGWKPGQARPNPFAADKPLFSIDAASADKYSDKLTPGQLATIKTIPGRRIDVYPTRRSCGYPDWYYERTKKNATLSKIDKNGWGLAESMGGAVPFPIPKSGYEAMWNHKLRWQGEGLSTTDYYGVIPPAGGKSLGPRYAGDEQMSSPMWSPKVNSVAEANGVELQYWDVFTEPPGLAGDMTLAVANLSAPTDLWLYFASQRRVRRAPTYQYDAPQLNYDNLAVVDQYLMFSGPMDRYDFQLMDKKELLIPYNNFPIYEPAAMEDLLTPLGFKPEKMRYELHRVWVVEAKLKSGVRHAYSRRTFYLDEDSWALMAADMYDAQGKLWRSMEATIAPIVELPACASTAYAAYDLQVGRFFADRIFQKTDWLAGREGRIKASRFTPEGMRRAGD